MKKLSNYFKKLLANYKMKLKTLNKIRKIAEKSILTKQRRKLPRLLKIMCIEYKMWEIIQKLKPNNNS